MEIFQNAAWNDTGDIVVYGYYHRYWLDRERTLKNDTFNAYSAKILELKKGKENAVHYFFDILDREINPDVTICVVPSSDAEKTESGMTKLGQKLAANGRMDKVFYLIRERTIKKLADGGVRSKVVHLSSIKVNEKMSIEGDYVLLIDDVTTTGNSLYACRDILLKNGAKKVEMLALGKAV